MNLETRQALQHLLRQMAERLNTLRGKREIAEGELRDLSAEIDELERRIAALEADMRS